MTVYVCYWKEGAPSPYCGEPEAAFTTEAAAVTYCRAQKEYMYRPLDIDPSEAQ